MPHVILEGRVPLDECQRKLIPFIVRDGDFLVKGERLYREHGAPTILIETLVVDHGHTQKFFIQVAGRGEGAIIRLEPLTDPEKTHGVRRALAVVAHRILECTGSSYGKSNIDEYLIR